MKRPKNSNPDGWRENSVNSLVVQADGPNDCYKELIQGILAQGQIVVSRGLEKKEIRPVVLILNNPRERFLMSPGRMIHPYFQVMESLWILGGRGDVEWISYYLKNMEKYADGLTEFHAPYGTRMRHAGDHRILPCDNNPKDQFRNCYEYLRKDPHTQQAVMTFWNPIFDYHDVETADRPCNVAFQFIFRNGALDLTIFNRSNDIHLGLFNTNIVQFSVILETMAMLLDIPVGNQIHMINSLHYYTDDPLTEKLLTSENEFNPYEFIRPQAFQHETENLTLEELYKDLDSFFAAEANVRTGQFVNPLFSFNYLEDAFVLARSFYNYRNHKDLLNAFMLLQELSADDIFVTCAEFLSRGIDDSESKQLVEGIVRDRFKNRLPIEDINRILHYIVTH